MAREMTRAGINSLVRLFARKAKEKKGQEFILKCRHLLTKGTACNKFSGLIDNPIYGDLL